MEEVFEGIYKISYPLNIEGIKDVNSYFIKEEKLLIDAGPGYELAYEKLLSSLESINLGINDIEYVILTHHHTDHMGMIKYFPKSIKIISDKLVGYYDSKKYNKTVKSFSDSLPLPSKFVSEIQEMLMLESTSIDWKGRPLIDYSQFSKKNFKISVSKGHSSKDAIIQYKNKYLFSGDIIIPKIFFNCLIDFADNSSTPCSEIRNNYENELNIVKSIDFLYLLPGHSRPIDKDETLRHIDITFSRMKRTETKVKKAIEEKVTFFDLINITFGDFLKYNKFLPFAEVYTILEKMNLLDPFLYD